MTEKSMTAAEILSAFCRTGDSRAAEELESCIELARSLADEVDAEVPLLLARPAKTIENAARRLLVDARRYALARDEDLQVLRVLQCKAELAQMINHGSGPKTRPWVGPCCANFLDVWQRLTKNTAVYEGSDALAFLTACCQLADLTVTENMVLKAYKDFETERGVTEESRAAAFETWWDGPTGRKVQELRELEKALPSRKSGAR